MNPQHAIETALRRLESPHGDVSAWRDQVLAELNISPDAFARLVPLCEDFLSSHDENLRAPLSGALMLGFLFGSAFGDGAAA
jgi:hypothetical protein